MTSLFHLLRFFILTVCGVQIMIRLIMQFPLACFCFLPVTSKNFLQRPDFRHPQPMSFLSVRDQIPHACKTSVKIVVCVFQCFRFYMTTEWQNILNRRVANIPEFILLLIYSWMYFRFVSVYPKYLKFFVCSKVNLNSSDETWTY